MALGLIALGLILARIDVWRVAADQPKEQPGGVRPVQQFDHGDMYRVPELGGRGLILLSLDFSPDGTVLASAGGGSPVDSDGAVQADQAAQGEVKLWDLASGKARQTMSIQGGIIFEAKFAPDGRMLATASGPGSPVQTTPGEIHLWNPATGELIRKFTSHACGAYMVSFSPDGKLLATGGIASFDPRRKTEVRGGHANAELTLWDLATGKALWTHGRHTGTVSALVFSPDGKTLASSGGLFDGRLILWDVASGTERGMIRLEAEVIRPVAFGPDNATLTVVITNPGGKDPGPNCTLEVSQWDTQANKQLQAVSIKNGFLYRETLSPSRELLACGCFNGVKLYDVAKQREVQNLPSKFRMRPVAFSPDNKLLAAGSDDAAVKLWSVAELRK